MRAFLTTALALLGLVTLAPAQDRMAEYSREFQRGIEALTAGRHDEGIAAFERCLAIVPKDPVSAYNIACGRALKGESDKAFEWLDKSAEWGFGNIDGQIAHAEQDADLASLRSDERFGRYIERMKSLRAKVAAFAKDAAVHVPTALENAAEVGLLVVLHDSGKTKNDVIASHWREVAEAAGLVLVAPSGLHALEGDPEKGMTFVRDFGGYRQRPWIDEKPILDAISAVKKTRKLDDKRVFLAAEGNSAPVAFNAAVSSPGLIRGVIVCDGPILPEVSASKATNAGKMGLAVQVLLRPGTGLTPPEPQVDPMATDLRRRFGEWGLRGEVHILPPAEFQATPYKHALAKALGQLAPAAATGVPAEAGAAH